ncbi:MAG: hypothetical protein CSA35_01895 [Dethiosulfovibrio peptidovorans]|nr:MAG: hypothetical protein CSA35_01895 [Dethiosulfovibrio peptidovorans]
MSEYTHQELMQTAMNYLPLIKKTAGRYSGRGAEWEDLLSQGFCEVLDLIVRCPEGTPLPLYMSNMLPGRVRDVARRLRRQASHDRLDVLAEAGVEPHDQRPYYSPQLLLTGIDLTPGERELIDCLLDGDTQREIAQMLGCTQQNVSYMVRKLQKKLRPLKKNLCL